MEKSALMSPLSPASEEEVAAPPTLHESRELGPRFEAYRLGAPHDEMFGRDGAVRGHYWPLYRRLVELQPDELARRQQASEQSFLHQGITFTVYGDKQATERIIPTDLLPRIITAAEWDEHRARAEAAHRGAQSVPARHLRRRRAC